MPLSNWPQIGEKQQILYGEQLEKKQICIKSGNCPKLYNSHAYKLKGSSITVGKKKEVYL